MLGFGRRVHVRSRRIWSGSNPAPVARPVYASPYVHTLYGYISRAYGIHIDRYAAQRSFTVHLWEANQRILYADLFAVIGRHPGICSH